MEGVEDLLAHHALDFRIGHAPVQRVGHDDVHIIDPVGVEQFQHDLQHNLSDVGVVMGGSGRLNRPPRWSRACRAKAVRRADHCRRMVERIAHGRARVGQAFDGRLGVDHRVPMAVLAENLGSREDDPRCGIAVDVDDLIVFLVAGHGPRTGLASRCSSGLMLTQIQNGPVML